MDGTRIRMSRREWSLIALWTVLAIAGVFVVARYFDSAFPEASIEFRYDRNSSRALAERFAAAQGSRLDSMRHAVRFDSDQLGRIFLERTLGLREANAEVRGGVRVWYWRHRWFVPLQEEEISVDVAPTGEIVGYSRTIPEGRRLPDRASIPPPLDLLRTLGVDPNGLALVGTSERRLPGRTQRIFTFESKTIRPAGAAYRHTVTLDGVVLTGYSQKLKVPDSWIRSYRELRSKNAAAGNVDLIFNAILLVGAVSVFTVRLRRGDLQLRYLIGLAIAAVLLVGGVALNSMPAQLAWYDTTSSYPAFLGQLGVMALLQSVGTAMLLIVVCGAGDVLYRERLPNHVAVSRIWTPRALGSKRVFLSLVLGYALVPMFMAYQVAFYLGATKFGAWAPAEVPYDDILNSALPWMAVLFAGFFPAFSEEYLSRAFAIPFLQKFLRWRFAAIVIAAFIWGFGHSTYPNQPFWIRGVEVGLAGVVAGLLMDRFGLLPLLVWHYTIDAVYTATLLLSSGNRYYIVSTALASLLFLLPLAGAIAIYVRRRGFDPDDELTNASIPTSPPPAATDAGGTTAALPPPIHLTSPRWIACAVAAAIAVLAFLMRPGTPDDVVEYRTTAEEAKQVAARHVAAALPSGTKYERVIATPVEGFRSWDAESPREDGGTPGEFDAVAAGYLLRHGFGLDRLTDLFRSGIEAATWSVRFFTPGRKDEVFVEVDPRRSRVVGFHRYVDERSPGAVIPKEAAAAIASRTLTSWGIDPRAFVLREALVFQQPARRDWLLHYDEARPLAAEAFRRVSVRISGDQVTQVAKTIRVPESVYYEESRQTLLNVVLLVLKIAGAVALLAIAISGLVIATRRGFPWRRALRLAALAAVVPVAAFFFNYERSLFGYATSVAWETFRVNLLTSLVRDVGVQAGLVFLAFAALEAAFPWTAEAFSHSGRARFGRSAVVAALTAVALLSIVGTVPLYLARAFPSRVEVALDIPAQAAMAWPAVPVVLRALVAAVVVPAGAALYGGALKKHAAALTIAAVFFASLDPFATPLQAPVSIGMALLVAVTVWVVGRYVLGANPLAWPLAVFLALVLDAAASLLQNRRDDLAANAVVLILVAAAALLWIASVREPRDSAPADGEPAA